MSNQKKKRTAKSGTQSQGIPKITIAVVAAMVVIFVIVVIANMSSKKSGSSATSSTLQEAEFAPPYLIQAVSTIPDSVFNAIGQGDASSLPNKISGQAITENGKPQIVYIGAEYCPYCAAERWATVIALYRFGTFSNLGITTSSNTDVFPDTPTFTFYGSTYSSSYLSFDPVEINTNTPAPQGGYTTLQTPTLAQQALDTAYNPDGSIPFIDFGNMSTVVGATLDPGVFKNQTYQEIAASLTNASASTTKAIVGAANGITASICQITKNQPSKVCETPLIAQLQSKIK